MDNTKQTSNRIAQLDGLRGLAILMVLSVHFLNDSNHGAFGTLLYRIGSAFRLGWAGVDLFFVLSGFLIGGILLDARNTKNYFRVFYARRLHRIIPLYYLWIALFVLGVLLARGWFSKFIPTDSSTLRYVPFYYLFLQNYINVPFGSLIWVWLVAAWSLGVEEQFYLLAPPLIRFLSLRNLQIALFATLLGAPILRILVYCFVSGGHFSIYVWMPCRADSLAFGVLAAAYWRDGSVQRFYQGHSRLFLSVTVILGAAMPIFDKWMFNPYTLAMASFGYTWLALFFTCLLLLSLLEPNSFWSSFLRLGFLREMGNLSYCIYLIHMLILHLSHAVLLHAPPRIYDIPGAAVSIFALLLTYSIAKLSWIFFERPLIRRSHSFNYR